MPFPHSGQTNTDPTDRLVEVSRHLSTGDQQCYAFLGRLRNVVASGNLPIEAAATKVRVKLIADPDKITTAEFPLLARLTAATLGERLRLQQLSGCRGTLNVALGEPRLEDLGHNWKSIVQPITDDAGHIRTGRTQVMEQLNKTHPQTSRTLQEFDPFLQVVQFKAPPDITKTLLGLVHANATNRVTLGPAIARLKKPLK